MSSADEIDYQHLDEKSKAARIAAVIRQEQWHRHMQPFEALQALRCRLAVSLLRERSADARRFVNEALSRIEKIQERLSLELMRIDFERWQEYIRLDTDELSEIVKSTQKHGDLATAAEMGNLIYTARIIVNAERHL
jgi:hypothetical protein